MSSARIAPAVPASTMTAATAMPPRRAQSSRPTPACSPVRTANVPMIEAKMPMPMMISGKTNPSESKSAT